MCKLVSEELSSIRNFRVFNKENNLLFINFVKLVNSKCPCTPIFTSHVSDSLILTLSVADKVRVYMVCPILGQ